MLVSDLSYSDYLGRLAIGKIINGSITSRAALICIGDGETSKTLNVSNIQTYLGPSFTDVTKAEPGEIIILAGIDDVHIGDTICTKEAPKALKRITVDEPTVSMKFAPNTSPFSGKEGKFVQSSKIKDRLLKEAMLNVAIKIEESPDREGFIVKGRGEFQMAILIEQMRREGFELTVGRPEVIYKNIGGKKCEPVEHLFVDCGETFTGIVTEKLSRKKGKMLSYVNHAHGRVRLEFSVPSRALIGYRDEFLTDTKGTGLMNSYFEGYEPYRGDFIDRFTGSLVSDRMGEAIAYALFNLEPRGSLFVVPGDPVYEGMIVGEHNRDNDLNVNPTKPKKLSNMRASGKDDAVTLTPILPMTLEKAIQFIRDDERVEITPKSIRLRKSILSAQDRKASGKKIYSEDDE
jgi:GTP-binding protein